MTPEDEKAIAREAAERATKDANVENRIANLETQIGYLVKAVIGGAVYLASQVWAFLSSGGALK
jgi:hypothetical protein